MDTIIDNRGTLNIMCFRRKGSMWM